MNTLCIDPEIVKKVETKVATQIGGRVRDFRVIARATGLVLQGRCRSHHAKQLVLQAVMDVAEVPVLANEITV